MNKEIIEALNWLDAIINNPVVCGGNRVDNNKALDIVKSTLTQAEKEHEFLEQINTILNNSFNETYEETMNKIYKASMKYNNEKARLEYEK